LENLAAFLAVEAEKSILWYASLQVVEVSFDDDPDAFRNINTVEELNKS